MKLKIGTVLKRTADGVNVAVCDFFKNKSGRWVVLEEFGTGERYREDAAKIDANYTKKA